MRWCPPVVVTAALLASVIGTAGCSHGTVGGKAITPSAPPARSSAVAATPPPAAVGLSPAGVTTRVDVPADSTEEEYFQACHAAKLWMAAQPKTGESLFEPYLAMVQTSPSPTAGTWNTLWADLTPARQAAVITAAHAGANDECG
jgi:Putative lipoprotein LpqV